MESILLDPASHILSPSQSTFWSKLDNILFHILHPRGVFVFLHRTVLDTPLQIGDNDCGVFISQYAIDFCLGNTFFAKFSTFIIHLMNIHMTLFRWKRFKKHSPLLVNLHSFACHISGVEFNIADDLVVFGKSGKRLNKKLVKLVDLAFICPLNLRNADIFP